MSVFLDEIDPKRRDELLDKAAELVDRYQLYAPAMIVVDGFRPVSFIASQAIHFFAPIANVVTGHPYASEVGFVLQDRENLDRLLDRLEKLAKEDSDGDDSSGQPPEGH